MSPASPGGWNAPAIFQQMPSRSELGTMGNGELPCRSGSALFNPQGCKIQNMSREYCRIFAAEAQVLPGFGEVPE